jgi:hypothetical protein
MNATLGPIGLDTADNEARMDRSASPLASQAAYRRLAIAILGLDPETLGRELRAARLDQRRRDQRAARLGRAA